MLIEADPSELGEQHSRIENSLLSIEARQVQILSQFQRRSSKVPQKGIRTKT